MAVYFVVFGVAVGIASLTEKLHDRSGLRQLPRKVSLGALLIACVLFGVSALRWEVGTDYGNYVSRFSNHAREVSNGELSLFGEPGLPILAWVAMQIRPDSAVMFALAAAITVPLFIRTIWRWAPAFSFGVGLYILAGVWYGSFNIVRQYIACAIIFSGHRYIIERKLGRWILIVILASLFHISALATILLYLVPTRRTSMKIQLTIIVLGIGGMLFMGVLIDSVAQLSGDARWSGEYVLTSVNTLRVAFAFVPITVFWMLKSHKLIESSNAWFYINMLLLYAASMLAASDSVLMTRFVGYIEPFIVIGLGYATMVQSAKERTILRAVILLVFGVFMYYDISGNSALSDFQWLFDRP